MSEKPTPRARPREDEPGSWAPASRRKRDGDGQYEGGWLSFKAGLRAWWPQIAFVLALVFIVGGFRADAAATANDHDRRLKGLEGELPKITRELTGLSVHSEVQSKTLLRLEEKIDRLMERDP